jgi:hypothetical protein
VAANMNHQVFFALFVLVGVLACVALGRHIGAPQVAGGGSTDIVDGAVYGLLSLLVAFTFSGAASRFDGRRDLMGREANAIGTAYLRLDLLPPEARDPLRDQFRRYADSRIAFFRKLPDIPAATAELDRSRELQGAIWSAAVEGARRDKAIVLALLVPVNEMIDIATTQQVATETHPPEVIYSMLAALALVSGLLIGRRTAGGSGAHLLNTVVYACVLASVVYVIRDLEYPRGGYIRVDSADRVLVDVREGMK